MGFSYPNREPGRLDVEIDRLTQQVANLARHDSVGQKLAGLVKDLPGHHEYLKAVDVASLERLCGELHALAKRAEKLRAKLRIEDVRAAAAREICPEQNPALALEHGEHKPAV